MGSCISQMAFQMPKALGYTPPKGNLAFCFLITIGNVIPPTPTPDQSPPAPSILYPPGCTLHLFLSLFSRSFLGAQKSCRECLAHSYLATVTPKPPTTTAPHPRPASSSDTRSPSSSTSSCPSPALFLSLFSFLLRRAEVLPWVLLRTHTHPAICQSPTTTAPRPTPAEDPHPPPAAVPYSFALRELLETNTVGTSTMPVGSVSEGGESVATAGDVALTVSSRDWASEVFAEAAALIPA
ncbi:hypothetical protein RUND412_002516 [Rhizina undulata]